MYLAVTLFLKYMLIRSFSRKNDKCKAIYYFNR